MTADGTALDLHCDRLSGRSRIGTSKGICFLSASRLALRSSFGAIEDWNTELQYRTLSGWAIAIVFRGDRGLEPASGLPALPAHRLRSSFGAIEDWNSKHIGVSFYFPELRSSFGAIEDWNARVDRLLHVCRIAIVFRGDRGLERGSCGAVRAETYGIAIVFRGDRGLEHR